MIILSILLVSSIFCAIGYLAGKKEPCKKWIDKNIRAEHMFLVGPYMAPIDTPLNLTFMFIVNAPKSVSFPDVASVVRENIKISNTEPYQVDILTYQARTPFVVGVILRRNPLLWQLHEDNIYFTTYEQLKEENRYN